MEFTLLSPPFLRGIMVDLNTEKRSQSRQAKTSQLSKFNSIRRHNKHRNLTL